MARDSGVGCFRVGHFDPDLAACCKLAAGPLVPAVGVTGGCGVVVAFTIVVGNWHWRSLRAESAGSAARAKRIPACGGVSSTAAADVW